MSNETTIKCPNCDTKIDVNKILYHQLENELNQKNLQERRKLEKEFNEKRENYKKAVLDLKQKENFIQEKKENFEQDLKKATEEQIKIQKEKLTKQLREEISNEQNEAMNLLKEELLKKSEQVKELNESKVQIEKLKMEKGEIESKIKAEAQLEINKKLMEEKERIKKMLDEQNELKFKQKDEQMEQLKKQLQDAQRKAELSSQQLQGEIQELAIEEYLEDKYPFDTIQEIKKGAKGGDCIQIVNTRQIQNCGKIYYESKRTKEFQKSWIEKFKADLRDRGADIGVLVSEVLPKELDRMGLINGIWICTYEEFKGLSCVLRESIIKINLAKKTQENKTGKMDLLYTYLTSTEFTMQVEAIVEGFTQMQSDLDSEKRSMNRIWKQRERQIEKVLENTIGMYGSIKGIAGNSIGNVKALELPYGEN